MGLELEIRNVLLCTVRVLLFAQVASFIICAIVHDASFTCCTSCYLIYFDCDCSLLAALVLQE